MLLATKEGEFSWDLLLLYAPDCYYFHIAVSVMCCVAFNTCSKQFDPQAIAAIWNKKRVSSHHFLWPLTLVLTNVVLVPYFIAPHLPIVFHFIWLEVIIIKVTQTCLPVW